MIGAIEKNHYGEDLPAYVNGTLDAERAGALAEHLADCADCQAEEADWRAVSAAAQTSVAAGASPRGLIDRVWLRIEAENGAGRKSWAGSLRSRLSRPAGRWFRPGRYSIAAGVAAVACLLLVAFAGARADGLFGVFKPKELAVVPVNLTELSTLPGLSSFGTLNAGTPPQPQFVDSAVAAASRSGLTVITPGSLPSSVPSAPSYAVLPANSAGFTFSAAKARAAAEAQGKSLPPMPADLDGASLQVSTGSAVITIYGGQPASAAAQGSVGGALNDIPTLVIGQTTAPTVTASGASADEIERYVLSLPGVSPQLADAIRALGSPGNAWPIPIPVDRVSSHPVRVQGVKGLAIGDSTGLGAGILWQKDGEIYAVAGTLSEQELLSVANSLH
jgi:hypothetical protein